MLRRGGITAVAADGRTALLDAAGRDPALAEDLRAVAVEMRAVRTTTGP